jgi:hypothetical protein
MREIINLAGKRFGRLIAVERIGSNKHHVSIWKCVCNCGKTTSVTQRNLVTGNTQSCGCLNRERTSKALLKNIAGKRFGRLVAVNRVGSSKNNGSTWKCKCDCNNVVIVQSASLINGTTKSCGCYNRDRVSETHFKDLTRLIFNRLTVLEYESTNDNRAIIWKCRCICGNEITVQSGSLINGHTKSCGCLQKDIMRSKCGDKSPAWRGGLSYELYGYEWTYELKEVIRDIFNRKCYLCNKLESENGKHLDVHHINYNKLDERICNLLALCHRCHMKTSNNRHYYFNMLVNNWIDNYLDGIADI